MSEQNNKSEDLKARLSADMEAAMGNNMPQVKAPAQESVPEVTPVREEPTHVEETVVEEAPTQEVVEEQPQVQPSIDADPLAALKQRVGTESDVPAVVEPSSVLAGIKIDLNAIEINDGASELDLLQNEKALQDKKVMQVVAVQSAYSAEMSALKNQEIQNISDANVDFYNYKKRLYKALWSHIENTSVGRMDFATWMKVTSYFDIETLLYGAYCQTFPYENKYSLRCPKPDCQTPFDAVVNNNTLIETRGKEKEIFAKINEVIANVKNAKDLVTNSHVHTTKRVSVDESKVVFDIHIPSVFDYLEGILSNVNEEFADEYSTTLGIALFIKQILVPDVVNYQRTGKLTFIPVTEKGKMIDLVSNLPYYDGLQIAEEINEFTERYRIDYSIKNVACPSCGHEIKEVPMSMEDVLFTVIRQGRRESNE
jgi:hypothetical protein